MIGYDDVLMTSSHIIERDIYKNTCNKKEQELSSTSTGFIGRPKSSTVDSTWLWRYRKSRKSLKKAVSKLSLEGKLALVAGKATLIPKMHKQSPAFWLGCKE